MFVFFNWKRLESNLIQMPCSFPCSPCRCWLAQPKSTAPTMTRKILFVVLTFVTFAAHRADGGESVRLAADGRALRTIGVAQDASESVRKSAQTLADILTKISGASFVIETADGTPGIVLGYRHYFPGEHGEVIPRQRELVIDVDTIERPDYLSRRIWYGYGTWDDNAEPYRIWCARNRCVAGIELHTGHSYDRVVRESRQQFEEHPDYWPLLDGKRQPVGNTKPCLGKQGVRDLFVRSALRRFASDPTLDSVSMDPSDGGGWCQ